MSVKDTYNEIAAHFSKTRKGAWGEFEVFRDFLRERFDNKQIRVLDVGCGNGRLIDSLKGVNFEYTGVDLSEELVKEARKLHPDQSFFVDDMTVLDSVKHEKFDAIFLVASFHHLDSEEKRLQALENVRELLSGGGFVFMTNWNLFQGKYWKYVMKAMFKATISKYKWNDVFVPFSFPNPNDPKVLKTKMRYYHAFTPYELEGLFEKSGIRVLEFFSYGRDGKVKEWKDGRNLCYILEGGN